MTIPNSEQVNAMIIEALAKKLVEDESLFDAALENDLQPLADILTEHAFMRLCLAIDCCPWHRSDLDCCADEGFDCLEKLANLV
jgi:hypothetical protein